MISNIGTVLLVLVALSSAQDETVTEELIRSQADLSLGHEFAETLLSINRGQISAYMHFIGSGLIDSHLDAYANVKEQILETNDAFDAFEVTEQNEACLNNVRNRWNLQISR